MLSILTRFERVLLSVPEDYRWSSIGYHVQSGNKDDFLSLDFGLEEFRISDSPAVAHSSYGAAGPADTHSSYGAAGGERFRIYRTYLYKVGAIDIGKGAQIDEKVLEQEAKTDFNLSRIRRFRYRTRYFSDSGIIGTKEFVSTLYQQFKNLFQSKREKIPKPIKGIAGVYLPKRLSEA